MIKIYVIALLIIAAIGVLALIILKFAPLKPAADYFLEVNLDPETKTSYEFRREEDLKRLELFPNTYEVYIDLGNIERGLGNASKSIEYYKKAWEIIPSNSTPWINIGNIFISLKLYDQAEEAFLKAKTINPVYPINYLNLAELYQKYLPGKADLIRGIYLEGLAAVENDGELLVPFATYLYESKNYSEALLYYQQLKEMYPERTDFQEMIDLINNQIDQ